MPTLRGCPSRSRAVSISFTFVAIAVAESTALAQQPFAPGIEVPAFSLSAIAAFADVNRDGSLDVLLPGPFFGTLASQLDENGAALATNVNGPGISPVVGAPTSPVALAMAGGLLDGDAREDVITVTAAGTVHFHRNLGSTSVHQTCFQPDVVVDNFLSSFPISPPFVNYCFPRAQIVDFDRDGHQDVVIGGGPVDRWSGATCPGFVGFYRGDGTGTFQVHRYLLSGSAIDVEVADLDNDGVHDHLVVLTETGSLGAFGYEILHLAFVNGSLVATAQAQPITPGRFTALELADVCGDANLDYVLAQTSSSAGQLAAQVWYFEGNGLGTVNQSVWGVFLLPPNLTGLGDFISSIQVGDWNRDSHPDLAVLRGFIQAPTISSSVAPVHADNEVLVALGPVLVWAPFASLPLPGYHNFSSTHEHLFSLLPLIAAPEFLHVLDLGRDGSEDLLVTGIRPTSNPTTTRIVTLRNTTPPVLGDARFEAIGGPSGGAPSQPARIGFEGGRPRPGNADFACTIQNIQGGCLVGLIWGSYAQANLTTACGFQLHLAPMEFSCGFLASGSQPGTGFFSFPLPIPPLPALVGDLGYFQYDYYDHVAGAFGGTQATGLWIGN
jgi:hypothetical protein